MQKEITVGSRVRSFDFDSRDLVGDRACYVEGTITSVGCAMAGDACPRYEIAVDRIVFGGKDYDVPAEMVVYPPMNGIRKLLSGDLTDGVELVQEVAYV